MDNNTNDRGLGCKVPIRQRCSSTTQMELSQVTEPHKFGRRSRKTNSEETAGREIRKINVEEQSEEEFGRDGWKRQPEEKFGRDSRKRQPEETAPPLVVLSVRFRGAVPDLGDVLGMGVAIRGPAA